MIHTLSQNTEKTNNILREWLGVTLISRPFISSNIIMVSDISDV